MKTIKPISELKTAQDFYDFFEAIPDEKWAANVFWNEDGLCCAGGHLGLTRKYPLGKSWEAFKRLDAICVSLAPDGLAGRRDTTDTNDGRNPAFQQPTPKARILAMLSDAIAKGL